MGITAVCLTITYPPRNHRVTAACTTAGRPLLSPILGLEPATCRSLRLAARSLPADGGLLAGDRAGEGGAHHHVCKKKAQRAGFERSVCRRCRRSDEDIGASGEYGNDKIIEEEGHDKMKREKKKG